MSGAVISDPAGLIEAIASSLSGSLRLGQRPVGVADWSRDDDAEGASTFRHDSGLRLEVRSRVHPHGLEWSSTLHNDGTGSSPLLSRLCPLDLTLPRGDVAVLSTINGSLCRLDDFLAWQETLSARPVHLEPEGGRSSDGTAPFFSLTAAAGSVAIAVGWSGQWAADLTADDELVRVTAGLADASLVLRPGEWITLPSIMIMVGDDRVEAENRLRRALDETVIPRRRDGSVVTPMAHMTMSTFHKTQQVSEASELAAVARTAELGLETFWVDACWYGDTPRWAEQVGNWEVRTDAFPRGLRPISDAAHGEDMRFVLWMEPERARAGTRIVTEHPDLFLTFPDQAQDLLLDLGEPAARELALELISRRIEEFAVDIYRQDFNIRPLAAWRAADAADRRGMHEIRHVEGLYWLWDRLRERHPGLVIDNCASGGRRIDLETLRRSVPLWRSDAADVGGGAAGDAVSVANQVQVSGLSRFVTQHTGPIWAFDPYAVRSALGTGFVVYCPLPDDAAASADLRAAIAEISRVRAVVAGSDLHVLISPTTAADAWSALQYHRPGAGDGLVVLLRRPGSTVGTVSVSLSGIDPDASYRVSTATGYQRPTPTEMSGSELADLAIGIDTTPGSCLVEYARID